MERIMKCTKCSHEASLGDAFCSRCGTKLETVCPECGYKPGEGDLFCSKCGARLGEAAIASPPRLEDMQDRLYIPEPLRKRMDSAMQEMEGENRLITALFADISGFTPMSQELSPEDTVEKVNQCFQAITDAIYRYEGNINRFIGDCVLAFFGAPISHEDDPERAIMSGLDMLDAVHQLGLEIKVGINTGMMYFGPIGTQEHQEISAYGEDINLAKRLQEEAQRGQIIVGERTHRFTRRAFEFETLQPLTLKGIEKPIQAYSAIKRLPKPEKIRGIEGLRARMIGRDDELAKLKDALDEVMHGRGQMVSIIGEAGVGKSRLVSELKKHALQSLENLEQKEKEPDESDKAPLWLEGRCLSLGVTASYWPFIDIFSEYLGWGTDDSDITRADSILSRLREMVDRGHLTEDRYDEIGPMLGNLLSVQFGNDWDDRLKNADPQQIRYRTFMAIRDFFMALSKERPVILILEDLHWSDSLSIDLISLLMEALTLAPLFLVCVYRPEKEHKSWHLGTIASQKCSERYTELHLRELTHGQSRRLVESLLRIDNLPPSVKEMVLGKSQGNPFFVEEVIRSLIEMGMVYQEGDRWHAREGIESIAVPETIQSVILSRIDRLEDELRHVLQSASVIGRLFRRSLLERVTQQESELERDLWDLEEHELIYQERIVPEEEYSFKHAFTQETVYESILSRRRAEIHQEIAESMELLYGDSLDEYYEQLAYHYDRSRNAEKAVEYLLKAGEKSQRLYQNDEAIAYFQKALELFRDSQLMDSHKDWHLSALKGLTQVHYFAGNMPKAESYARDAIALGKEIGLPARDLALLYSRLADTMFWQDRHDERWQIGEEGLAILGDDTRSVEAALMNTHIAVGYGHGRNDKEKFREFNLRNVQFIQDLPYSSDLINAYHYIITMYSTDKDIEEAAKWASILEQLGKQHNDLNALAVAQSMMGLNILRPMGDLHGAFAAYEKALATSIKAGNKGQRDWELINIGINLIKQGYPQKALEYGYRSLPAPGDTTAQHSKAESYMIIFRSCVCLHSYEKALEIMPKLFEASQGAEIGDFHYGKWASMVLGWLYLHINQRQKAMDLLQETIAHNPQVSLSGLEAAYDSPYEFRSFCDQYREEHPETTDWPLKQWYLEPDQASEFPKSIVCVMFADELSSDWVWHDQFSDCSYTVQDGLEIHAANGRDLWEMNLSAPRILRKVTGDFAVQTCCMPVSGDMPTIGGIVLWKDRENFLRLGRGMRGEREIALEGCINNKDVCIGRGHLNPYTSKVFLRLERIGMRINALCSSDGDEWFSVGHADFPVDDPVEIGLHAIGNIYRDIYHGAFPDGTDIRFEYFKIYHSE
jgi:predicted ATPase/class 3 adenylate cyclase/regulation of enolase protein 1 (concanavalin A-like superfamily)